MIRWRRFWPELVLLALAALATAASPGSALGAEPDADRLAAIDRELRIAEDVFRSALGHERTGRGRVTRIAGHYLADQGALLTISLAVPWINLQGLRDRDLPLEARQAMADIPELVHSVLRQLDIAVAPYAEEHVATLRRLSRQERALRDEQRSLRAGIRELRRAIIRNRDPALELELSDELAALNAELADSEERLDRLQAEMAESVEEAEAAVDAPAGTVELDPLVAGAVCDYGNTFRSLDDGERLTLLLQGAAGVDYFVYRVADVRACQRGRIDSLQLSERSTRYRRD